MDIICNTIGNFAALTSILAKIGIEGVNSNLATAVRTIVVVIMAWLMVLLRMHRVVYLQSAKELDIPDSIWTSDGCILDVLL